MSDIQLKYKPDFERVQKYWGAFWEGQIIDRPCTVIYAKKSPDATYPSLFQTADGDFFKTFQKFDVFLESWAFLGECMPGFRPAFGPDQFAGFAGMEIEYSIEHGTSWSRKNVDNWYDFLPITLKKNHIWNRMLEFHRLAQDHYKNKCLLWNIDLHSNIDFAEAVRGAERLLFDIIDTPEIVHEVLLQARQVRKEVWDALYVFGNKKELGTTMSLNFLSQGAYDRVQADFICLLSPTMFRDFVLPEIEWECDSLDHSCFHLDGIDALAHLEDILSIKSLDAIEWVPGAGKKEQIQWLELLTKIQAAGKAVILNGKPDEIKAIHPNLKPELTVYQAYVDSESEGHELLRWLTQNT